MPIVRPYPIGEASPQPLPNVAPNVPAAGDINLFGGNRARDLQLAGQQLGQASDSLFALYQREAQDANDTRVQDFTNRFLDGRRAILQTGPDAYYNQTGTDAITGADTATGKLAALRDEVFGQTANGYQREKLAPILGAHLAASAAGIARHAVAQQEVYSRGVAASAIETSRAEAIADPSMMTPAMMRAEGAARVLHAGQPPEAVEAGVRAAAGSVIAGVIRDRLSRNDPQGIALFRQHADRLDPNNRRTLSAAAETLSNTVEATAWLRDRSTRLDAEKTPIPTGDPALDAVNASAAEPPPVASSSGTLLDQDGIAGTRERLDEIESRRRALTALNESEFATNPARLRANRATIDADTARNRAAVKAESDSLYADLRRHLTTGGPDGSPAVTPPATIMSRLTDAQQDAVMAQVNGALEGLKTRTDPQTWYTIRQGLTVDDSDERERRASKNLVQFMGRLSAEDFAALEKLQTAVHGNDAGAEQSRLQTIARMANQALQTVGIDPTPRPDAPSDSDAAQAARFHRALQAELSAFESKGRMPTEAETYEIVNGLKDAAIKSGWLKVNDPHASLTVLSDIPATDDTFHKSKVLLAQAGSQSSPSIETDQNNKAQRSSKEPGALSEQYGPHVELLPKVDTVPKALFTWMFGSGEARTYPLDRIDTKAVKPAQFPGVLDRLAKGIPGAYAVDSKIPFYAGKDLRNLDRWKIDDLRGRLIIGNMYLRLRGQLTIGADGNYSFNGRLSGEPDFYQMYKSTHRNLSDEKLTAIGKVLGSFRHRDYWIHFLGEKPISTSNNLTP